MENIFKLLSSALQHNIITQNAYRTRFIGFKSEALFADFLEKRGTSTLKGGFFIPVIANEQAYENFIYYTIINDADNIDDYISIYKHISTLNYKKLIVVRYESASLEKWKKVSYNNIEFPVPDFKFHLYENGKFTQSSWGVKQFVDLFVPSKEKINIRKVDDSAFKEAELQMSQLTKEKLIDIYVNRLFFDIILGRNIIKGIPADIDFIIKGNDGNMFVELKEKDLAKSTVGFGLDRHRMEGMIKIQKKTGIPYYLVVRQVDNQRDRNFLKYWIISIDTFSSKRNQRSIEGGEGMRSVGSSNPTFICKLEYFTELI